LIKENLEKVDEVYICGAPAMVESAIQKLEEN
jgi:NAD(P)H-flavin reductase